MSAVAFVVVAFMFAAYVVADGFDLGAAAIAPLVARGDSEREAVMKAVSGFAHGNEVWLIAAGGTLFMLFPRAYAASFSGFYLPFIVALWLLMFRGVSLELRSHFPSDIWHQFWDACFTGASALLVFVFGIALGNLVRGVPLDAQGFFAGTFAFLLNPYAILVGLFALAALAQHGLAFLQLRVDGALAMRVRALTPRVWLVTIVVFFAVSAATFAVRAQPKPWFFFILPAAALASLVLVRLAAHRREDRLTFAASAVFVALLVTTAAVSMFPYLLPAFPAGGAGLSIYDAAPSPTALVSGLSVAIVGICAVLAYSAWAWKKLAGKVSVGE